MNYYYNRFDNIQDHAEVLAELGHDNCYFVAKALEYLGEKADYFILKTANNSGMYLVEYQVGRQFRQESSAGLTTSLARAIHSLDAIKRAVESEECNDDRERTRESLLATERDHTKGTVSY